MPTTSMPVTQALDYSVGRSVAAAQAASTRLRDAIQFAQWSDRALSLRNAIQRLSSPHPTAILRARATWKEPRSSETAEDHLKAAIASAEACLRAVEAYVVKQAKRSEKWDVVFASIEDGNVAVLDMNSALKGN